MRHTHTLLMDLLWGRFVFDHWHVMLHHLYHCASALVINVHETHGYFQFVSILSVPDVTAVSTFIADYDSMTVIQFETMAQQPIAQIS